MIKTSKGSNLHPFSSPHTTQNPMIQELSINTLYPFPNATPGVDNCRAEFTSHFVDIVCFISNPLQREITTWQKTPLRLGVFEGKLGIPFIIVQFQDVRGWSFDVPLNVLKVSTAQRQWWNGEAGNWLNLILVDARTNQIVAMRQLGIYPSSIAALSQSLVQQTKYFHSINDVENATHVAMGRFSTQQMLNKSESFVYAPTI